MTCNSSSMRMHKKKENGKNDFLCPDLRYKIKAKRFSHWFWWLKISVSLLASAFRLKTYAMAKACLKN